MKQAKLHILPVKPVIQENGYECGLSCVMTILRTNGLKMRKDSLKQRLGTTRRHGTHPERIKGFLKELNIKHRERHLSSLEELEKRLRKSQLCLVVYQAWGSRKYYEKLESGHYSVVFGSDEEYLWLADPFVRKGKKFGKGIRRIRKEIFDGRWKDVDHEGKLYERWMLAV